MIFQTELHQRRPHTARSFWGVGCWNLGFPDFWNCELLDLGTLETWNPGTLETWNPGILESCPGILEALNRGIM